MTRFQCFWFAVAVTMLSAATNSMANAQVTGVRTDGFRQSTIVDRSLLNRGRMEVALNLAGSVSFSDSSSDTESNRQLNAFANPGVVFGYMLSDALELRGDLGYRFERASSQDVRIQNSHALSLAVQALYHAPLPHGLAIYGGLGLGGFSGWTTHPTGTQGLVRSHTTVGGIAQLLTGLLIQPGPNFTLRAGLRIEGTYGVELGAEAGAEDVQSANVHVAGELALGFRFGG